MTIKKMPQMVSAMTPFPYHIDIGEPAYKAEEMMHAHGFRHLPVLDGDVIEGMVSERDLARATAPGHTLLDEPSLLVGDICATRVFVADVSDPLDRILDVMAKKHIGAVVVAKDGVLAGIFTDADACRILATQLREHYISVYSNSGGDDIA